ncbi:MAG: alpha-mannosidase [Synechococcus sp. SB0667_bin_8]|nr:alpha-mannosidase [Synechococcus sp. SB0667_bin_8]
MIQAAARPHGPGDFPWKLDLQHRWRLDTGAPALAHVRRLPLRQDWQARGDLVWPRGGCPLRLHLVLTTPLSWQGLSRSAFIPRLVLLWWAETAVLKVDGTPRRHGDLFANTCRLPLPASWLAGRPLLLELELHSPRHDEGSLRHSNVVLEPRCRGEDPLHLLRSTEEDLAAPGHGGAGQTRPRNDHVTLLSHAHLDLAWLWPVAETWRAAVDTFTSVLNLMEEHPDLCFGHSTPALYAWLQQHRPALWQRIHALAETGRWEPLCGPWVEMDCVLISTVSVLRQLETGQRWCQQHFPQWRHDLAWLPDSFGFAAGLPQALRRQGIGWFVTTKLSWNDRNSFPHRLFRWRDPSGAEVLALLPGPLGGTGDPRAIQQAHGEWRARTGVNSSLWLPGVGNHGGGPNQDLMDQVQLWWGHPQLPRYRHGTLRSWLEDLKPLAPTLPVWADELYLELHRGCATTHPDQKRHNRTAERLLLEAERVLWLAQHLGHGQWAPAGEGRNGPLQQMKRCWQTLLFHQFHDILPGTATGEVFAQLEAQWRRLRRQASRLRDQVLHELLGTGPRDGHPSATADHWVALQLQPAGPWPRVVCLPQARQHRVLPPMAGLGCWRLQGTSDAAEPPPHPVRIHQVATPDHWQLDNGLCTAHCGPEGVLQLFSPGGRQVLGKPLGFGRWRDRGEYWDAWDLAPDHRQHPLGAIRLGQPELLERNSCMVRLRWRGAFGQSRISMVVCLAAGSPYLELRLSIHWRQAHELLSLDGDLAQPVQRWAADTAGGVIERPARPRTAREQSRWHCAVVSWMALLQQQGGLAVLLDGPQGIHAQDDHLSVALLRGTTWPDPGADRGWWRHRIGLMPLDGGWCGNHVPAAADHLRWPLWLRPLPLAQGHEPARQLWFPWPESAQRLLELRPAADGRPSRLSLQQLAPWRGRLAWLKSFTDMEPKPLQPWEIRSVPLAGRSDGF